MDDAELDDAEIRRMAAEVTSRVADYIEAANPLNKFLMAGTRQEAAQVLVRHPQLMSAEGLGEIDNCIAVARLKGYQTQIRYLEGRRELLQNYGAALGLLPPPPLPQTPSRRRWPLLLAAVVIILAVGVAAAVIALRSPPASLTSSNGYNSANSSPPSQPADSSLSSQTAEQRAAGSLSALLAQSAVDRRSIQKAVSDVSQCGPNLAQDSQTLLNAATSRKQLLSELANLPDSSALPAQMTQALATAWQASAQADQDFAAWAQDENSQGCTINDTSDPNYQAAAGPDDQATTSKAAFVGFWNPIATKYGLTTYQSSQL
jgi:hypothetical protein